PFCILMLWASWDSVVNSWSIRETSPDPGGLIRYPIKTAIVICFILLIAQALSEAIKQISILREPQTEPQGDSD
ncbi:MAG: C4-dicarboxylate ABC transporter substrate-binding protein, partial [Verrucomicrobiota bacterium]